MGLVDSAEHERRRFGRAGTAAARAAAAPAASGTGCATAAGWAGCVTCTGLLVFAALPAALLAVIVQA